MASATSVESGGATTCSAGTSREPGDERVDAVEHLLGQREVARRRRSCCTTAQAAASGPPDLVDCSVELSIV